MLFRVARQPFAKQLVNEYTLRDDAGGGVFSVQLRSRHTATLSLPEKRCCKHGDATQLSPLIRLRVYKRSLAVCSSFRGVTVKKSVIRSESACSELKTLRVQLCDNQSQTTLTLVTVDTCVCNNEL
jgi:hypothetical protein